MIKSRGVLVAIFLSMAALMLSACSRSPETELRDNSAEARLPPLKAMEVREISQGDLFAVIVIGDGEIIAVGPRGRILRSTDHAATWGKVDSSTPHSLHAVIQAGDQSLVAVGGGGAIVRSTDRGASWRAVSAGIGSSLKAIIKARDQSLVAISSLGTIIRSTNHGVSWVAVKQNERSLQSGLLSTIIEASDQSLVAIGISGAIFRSSDHGASWVAVRGAGAGGYRAVVLAGDQSIVAVGTEGSVLRSDDNGVTWDEASPGPLSFLSSVVQADDQSLVGVGDGGAIVRSTDHGKSWAAVDSGTSENLHIVVQAGDQSLVGVGDAGTIVRSTDHGKSWVAVDSGTSENLWTIVRKGDHSLVAAGSLSVIVHSIDDGASWGKDYSRGSKNQQAVVRANDKIFGTVTGQGAIAVSSDRRSSWDGDRSSATLANFWAILRVSDQIIVATGERGEILRSTDNGERWTTVLSAGFSAGLRVIIQARDQSLVAVGQAGWIQRSTDYGASWNRVDSGTSHWLEAIVQANDKNLVAVGHLGAIVLSTDNGESWTAPSSGTTENFNAIIQAGDRSLVAIGDKGIIVRSIDNGASWGVVRGADIEGTSTLNAIVQASDQSLIAVSSSGAILRSSDHGAHWNAVRNDYGSSTTLNAVIKASDQSLVAVGGSEIVRSTDHGASWVAIRSEAFSILHTIVQASDQSLVAVGGDILRGGEIVRSTDHGASWTAVDGPVDSISAITHAGGEVLVAVGNGYIVKLELNAVGPVIARLAYSYQQPSGRPFLIIGLTNRENGCAQFECLKVEGHSEADHNNDVPDRQFKIDPTRIDRDGNLKVDLDPAIVSAIGTSFYVRAVISVPSLLTQYPRGGGYFKIDNNPIPLWQNPWAQAIGSILMFALMLFCLAVFCPLWVLKIETRRAAAEQAAGAELPSLSAVFIKLFLSLMMPVLIKSPWVLDAWLKKHRSRLVEGYNEAVLASVKKLPQFISLPVSDCDGNIIPASPTEFHRVLTQGKGTIQIVGSGGSGKTRLAIEIGRWASEGRLFDRPVAAIFIDEDFTDLSIVVRGKLSSFLDHNAPGPELCSELLRTGRLVLIVDRVSERETATQTAIARIHRSTTVRHLICTMRRELTDKDVSPTEIRTRPLDQSTLLSFLAAQIRQLDTLGLFGTLTEQGALIQRLAALITLDGRELPITPLLVKLFLIRALSAPRTAGDMAFESLPANIPETYFAFIDALDQTWSETNSKAAIPPTLFRRAAAIVAMIELGEDFRPKPVDQSVMLIALTNDARVGADSARECLERLKDNELLTSNKIGDVEFVEFVLDPLAEVLGAYLHATICGRNPVLWQALIERVAERGAAGASFMLALRLNHVAYKSALSFPDISFP